MMTKQTVKGLLRWNHTAYKTAEAVYENSMLLRHILQQGLGASAIGHRVPQSRARARQSVTTWRVPFPPFDSAADLIEWLRAQGVTVNEGGHTFYVGPQDAIRQLLPTIVAAYPQQSGFKILKDCRHPVEARYLHKHRRSLQLLKRVIGRPQDQLVPANYMYALGIGPRVWDLACWEAHGRHCAVFVVDHVVGSEPTLDQCRSFLHRLKQLNTDTHLRIIIPDWERHEDFTPPDCHNNLVYSERLGRAAYIDFQNFGLTGLPRQVPTAADVADDQRWNMVRAALRRRAIGFGGRVVLDIGCGASGTIRSALAAGARWAVGWCRHGDQPRIEEALFLAGATRFSLIDSPPLARHGFVQDMPAHARFGINDAIVFFRGTPGAAAIPASLAHMPWEALVCDSGSSALRDVAVLQRRFPSERFEIAVLRSVDTPVSLTLILRRHADSNS